MPTRLELPANGRAAGRSSTAAGRAAGISPMWSRLFKRFEGRGSLQLRISDMLAHAIHEGLLAPGAALPSTRELADALSVSRVTVTLALQRLTDTGLVVALARSGHRVHPDALREQTSLRSDAVAPGSSRGSKPVAGTGRGPDWEQRLKQRPGSQRNIVKPANWQQLPYPFIYGQFDATLFPLAQWRECALETLHVAAIRSWAPDHIDRDHEPLIEQIQQRLLPARGIWARREEILVTAGAQQAMSLLTQLLVGPRTTAGIEDPGFPDMRNNVLLRSAAVRALKVDEGGLVIEPALARCRYIYVTPSHQCPTTVTMSFERRQALLECAESHDIVVIEDDHESELNFSGHPSPALKSLDRSGRVIYVGSLSKTLAHGLRIGYVVAPARLVEEMRALRRLAMRHPATNNEHTAALFIGHGYHAGFMSKLNAAYKQRAAVLVAALGRHLPQARWQSATGGSALWVTLPRGHDTRRLAARALEAGIVIEPGDVFFAGAGRSNHMRLGYSSIALDRIDEGVKRLARVLASG